MLLPPAKHLLTLCSFRMGCMNNTSYVLTKQKLSKLLQRMDLAIIVKGHYGYAVELKKYISAI